MSSIVKDLIEKYKKFVTNNSESIGQIESAARILSYVAPGSSGAVSELLSSIVSLVVLLNDYLLRNAANIQLQLPLQKKCLAFCLTVLEYVEVFLELATFEKRGDRARWFTVVSVQIVKSLLRFIMLFKDNAGILPSPPIPSLKRDKKLHLKLKNSSPQQSTIEAENAEDVTSFKYSAEVTNSKTFTLKSTGRVVRSLGSMTTVNERMWSSPTSNSETEPSQTSVVLTSTPLNDQQKLAECLHIIRPLVHLACMYFCGVSSWKPWLIACGVDLSSLFMMGGPENFNPVEKEELKRRTFSMLLYLLRSPFYDRFSKAKLLFLLGFLAHNVPVVRVIIRPLLEYLPVWQKTYFYVWMS